MWEDISYAHSMLSPGEAEELVATFVATIKCADMDSELHKIMAMTSLKDILTLVSIAASLALRDSGFSTDLTIQDGDLRIFSEEFGRWFETVFHAWRTKEWSGPVPDVLLPIVRDRNPEEDAQRDALWSLFAWDLVSWADDRGATLEDVAMALQCGFEAANRQFAT